MTNTTTSPGNGSNSGSAIHSNDLSSLLGTGGNSSAGSCWNAGKSQAGKTHARRSLLQVRSLIGIGCILHVMIVLRDGYHACQYENSVQIVDQTISSSSSSTISSSKVSVSLCGSRSSEVRSFNVSEWDQAHIASLIQSSLTRRSFSNADTRRSFFKSSEHCALLFFGLPRSFFSLTLPSVIENILIPNAPYNCHVFVNYHALHHENATTHAGTGGAIDPDEILLLRESMRQVGVRVNGNDDYQPNIRFCSFTEDEFAVSKYGSTFRNLTRHVKDEAGNPLFFALPETLKVYTTDQIDNILRMWHSQEAVWSMLEASAAQWNVTYTRAAMLRSDFFYLTPIDILEHTDTFSREPKVDYDNKIAVYFKWPADPVMDTFFMGPARGVKAWAGAVPGEDHMALMHSHILFDLRKNNKHRMYLPQYMYWTLFPAVERQNVTVVKEDVICAARVRAGDIVWLDDCARHIINPNVRLDLTKQMLNRETCVRKLFGSQEQFYCPLLETRPQH